MSNVKDERDILIVIQASIKNERIHDRLWRPLIGEEGCLSFLIGRLRKAGYKDIVLAVSDDVKDHVFTKYATDYKVGLVSGEFYEIPKRLIKAAENSNADSFVRINATNPLIDIHEMQVLYNEHKKGMYDYSFNEHKSGLVWGTGCDVFNTSFLKELSKTNLTNNQKETIGQFIRQNVKGVRVLKLDYDKSCPGYKVSLDTEKDYEVVREIAGNVKDISHDSIIKYLNMHPLIAGYNIEKPPEENGVEKLLYSPEKVKNIIDKKQPDLSYPISVELTLTNECNLACKYCSDRELRKRQGIREHMELETIKNLFDDLSMGGTKGIVLEGGGEPTMYQWFNEVVECASDVGLAVGLITNGTKTMDESLLKKFEWVRVSLDASTSEEYREIKGVDMFEKVMSNISEYADHCKTVGVGYVITNKNISRIEPLIIRLKEAGASYVQCRPVVDSPDLYPTGVDLSYLKYYENKYFGVAIEGMKDNAKPGNDALPCYAHSITSIISGDGSVYICGRLNIYDWLKPIGNIKENRFHTIWNGEERRNQAKMLADGEFCKNNCPQCRITKFNNLFHRLDSVKSVHFI